MEGGLGPQARSEREGVALGCVPLDASGLGSLPCQVMGVALKRATVYLESELHQALQRKAAAMGRTISDLIKEAVREDLEEEAEDLVAIQERAGEPGIPFEEVVRDLKR